VSNDLLNYLITRVDGELTTIEQDLAVGHAKDYAEYKHTCGLYRGLLLAKNILTETSERMETDNE
jgi:hypothetical protein|tara:strand:+ start:1309 stop:1503 length:195 start_codon:yes stop_codon:yes gene_type:complete